MSFGVVTFLAAEGPHIGVLVGDHVRDATPALAPLLGDRFGMLELLEQWDQALPALRRVAETEGGTWQVPLARTHLLAPLPRPVNLYCAFANYMDHMREMGGTPADKTVEDPFLFLVPGTAVTAPGSEIVVPVGPEGRLVEQLDWEGELAAVIGRQGRNLSPERALEYVAGYTIVHDVSIRGGARRGANGGRPDFLASKGRATFKPMGPAIVPAEFVGDPQALRLQT
ncbi:MAG: fumarylacetoacetate hydrolase family protein, partial [Dehalococcoidia bacterium]